MATTFLTSVGLSLQTLHFILQLQGASIGWHLVSVSPAAQAAAARRTDTAHRSCRHKAEALFRSGEMRLC